MKFVLSGMKQVLNSSMIFLLKSVVFIPVEAPPILLYSQIKTQLDFL